MAALNYSGLEKSSNGIKRVNIYLIMLAAFLLQGGILDHLRIFGARADLMLACTVFFGLYLQEAGGLEAGLIAGVLKDIASLDYIGINTFIFSLVGFTAGLLNTKFFKESKWTQLILVYSFMVFSMSLHYILVSIFSRSISLTYIEYIYISIIPASILTSIIAIPIFSKFIDIYHLREMEELL